MLDDSIFENNENIILQSKNKLRDNWDVIKSLIDDCFLNHFNQIYILSRSPKIFDLGYNSHKRVTLLNPDQVFYDDIIDETGKTLYLFYDLKDGFMPLLNVLLNNKKVTVCSLICGKKKSLKQNYLEKYTIKINLKTTCEFERLKSQEFILIKDEEEEQKESEQKKESSSWWSFW